MTDYGIKIAKKGFSVHDPITESNKKNYIVLNTVDAHKIIYAGYVTGGSYNHNLGYVPYFDVWYVDSITNPTIFTPVSYAEATDTHIQGLPNQAYLMIYNEGNK